MSLYQLEVAIFLAVFAVCSLAIFWLTAPTDGQIKLPEYVDEDNTQPDPFDVTKPEDLVDGHPIDERGFYDKVSSTNRSLHLLQH